MARFIVIGKQGAGKTTFARALARELDTKATDTSTALVRIESERQHILGYGRSAAVWDVVRARPVRRFLVALGDALKVQDKAILGRLCFAQGDVCCGVRRVDELAAIRAEFPDAKVIFVDRRGGEEADPSDNFDIPEGLADIVILNDGSLEDLGDKAKILVRVIRGSL